MTTHTAQVYFRERQHGGKLSGPPSGPVYAATAVAVMGNDAEVLPGWPASAPQFSVVLEFDTPPLEAVWSPARVRPLVDGAPGTEALVPGAELLVMEGPRDVARLVLDQDGTEQA